MFLEFFELDKTNQQAHQTNNFSDVISVPKRSDGRNGGQGKVDGRAWHNGCSSARKRAVIWVTLKDPNKTYSKAHRMSSVYEMSGPMRMAGANKDEGKATDVLGTMVAVVPMVVRATDMGAL